MRRSTRLRGREPSRRPAHKARSGGGANEETVLIKALGSLVLEEPLEFAHTCLTADAARDGCSCPPAMIGYRLMSARPLWTPVMAHSFHRTVKNLKPFST